MIQVYKQSSVLPSKVYINTLFTARMSSPDEDSLHTPLPQEIIDLMEMSLRLSTEPDPQEHSVDPDSGSPLAHSPANSSPSPKEECTESADLVQDDGKPWWGEPSGSQLKRSPSPDPNSRLLLTSFPFMEVFHSGTQKIKHATVTRRQVEQSLPWFQHLRAHLRASNNILNEYSETEFLQAKFNPPSCELCCQWNCCHRLRNEARTQSDLVHASSLCYPRDSPEIHGLPPQVSFWPMVYAE